jgi:hypothetical protein
MYLITHTYTDVNSYNWAGNDHFDRFCWKRRLFDNYSTPICLCTPVQAELCLSLHLNRSMKECGRVEVQLRSFFTSALKGFEWSASCPGSVTPGKIIIYSTELRLRFGPDCENDSRWRLTHVWIVRWPWYSKIYWVQKIAMNRWMPHCCWM